MDALCSVWSHCLLHLSGIQYNVLGLAVVRGIRIPVQLCLRRSTVYQCVKRLNLECVAFGALTLPDSPRNIVVMKDYTLF